MFTIKWTDWKTNYFSFINRKILNKKDASSKVVTEEQSFWCLLRWTYNNSQESYLSLLFVQQFLPSLFISLSIFLSIMGDRLIANYTEPYRVIICCPILILYQTSHWLILEQDREFNSWQEIFVQFEMTIYFELKTENVISLVVFLYQNQYVL